MAISNSLRSSYRLLDYLFWMCTTSTVEAKDNQQRNNKALRKQMTSIGRFSLASQTEENPSIISFFVALAHKAGEDIDIDALSKIWEQRVMQKHERFGFKVSDDNDGYFEPSKKPLQKYFSSKKHPSTYNYELNDRIQSMLLSPFDVKRGLWEAHISSGELGSSGAINQYHLKTEEANSFDRETVVLFRIHHSLCDGVSLSVAIGDLADESEQLKERIKQEFCRKLTQHKNYTRILFKAALALWYCFASILVFLLQLWRVMTASSPFDRVLRESTIPPGARSITWKNIGSLQEVKLVSKSLSKSTTVNDLVVYLVAHAVRCQLTEHGVEKEKKSTTTNVNVVIPVHLNGGIIRDGESVGNKIGAFVASIPLPNKNDDLTFTPQAISKALQRGKNSPAALVSWILAKLTSTYTPNWFSRYMIKKFNAKSVAVISNVKGWPFHVHWLGRKVGSLCAFLPLPPGIPIGIVLQSYDGQVSFSINADKRAVPDANKFAQWMLDEFHRVQNKKCDMKN